MSNEWILIFTLVASFAVLLLSAFLFGKQGVIAYLILATVGANIEVLLVIRAFGIEQTLGNILICTTFLATDILSENEGKGQARLGVQLGIFASLSFLLLSQSWLWYLPAEADTAAPHFAALFSRTPRILLASLLVGALVQGLDVLLYHRIWQATERRCGSTKRFLWLRNNAATLISQAANAILFHFAAFYRTYDTVLLWQMILAGFLIFAVVALLDTPMVYLVRHLKEKKLYGILLKKS